MSVLIATPCYGGMMSVGFQHSLTDIHDTLAPLGIQFDILVTKGDALVTRARNNLVATFLNRTPYDTLAMIDADVDLAGKDFLKLLNLPHARGAAVCMKTEDHSVSLSCWIGGKQYVRGSFKKPFACDYLGAAVLFVDRADLKIMWAGEEAEFGYDSGVGPAVQLFREMIVNRTDLSEDYGFCHLLKKYGIPLVCDPSIVVSHYGQSSWRG